MTAIHNCGLVVFTMRVAGRGRSGAAVVANVEEKYMRLSPDVDRRLGF
jgi:hypothetical protein